MANDSRRWFKENPDHLLMMGTSILVIGLAIFVGGKARAAERDLQQKRSGWEQAANQLATVQQQFRAPTGTESSALLAEGSRLGTLGVQPDDKLGLIDAVGHLAESAGLTDVQVNTKASTDSVYASDRSIPGSSVRKADYALTVDCDGGFAAAVQFVSTLPPSVSVSRFYAARAAPGARYRIILSVYELDAKPAE
jgi:hypothetical protein